MADVVGGGTTNVTLYDEDGARLGTVVNPVVVQAASGQMPRLAWAASLAGGRTAFNSTGLVSITNTGEQPTFALVNPADSQVDLEIHTLVQSLSTASVVRRYRNATISGGTAQPNINRGGGTNTSKARFLTGYTRTGGTLGKVQHLGANVEPVDQPDGSIVLRPGDNLAWTIVGPATLSAAITVSAEPVWIERPAQ